MACAGNFRLEMFFFFPLESCHGAVPHQESVATGFELQLGTWIQPACCWWKSCARLRHIINWWFSPVNVSNLFKFIIQQPVSASIKLFFKCFLLPTLKVQYSGCDDKLWQWAPQTAECSKRQEPRWTLWEGTKSSRPRVTYLEVAWLDLRSEFHGIDLWSMHYGMRWALFFWGQADRGRSFEWSGSLCPLSSVSYIWIWARHGSILGTSIIGQFQQPTKII